MVEQLQRGRTGGMAPRRGGNSGVRGQRWPRVFNVVLGAWLFLSAWLWPHPPASRLNTGLVGALILLTAVWGLRMSVARWMNMALAIWLAFSTLTLYHVTEKTQWNNLLVALGVLLFSLVPSEGKPPRGRYVEA